MCINIYITTIIKEKEAMNLGGFELRGELRGAGGRKEKGESDVIIILKCIRNKKIKTYFRLLASQMIADEVCVTSPMSH